MDLHDGNGTQARFRAYCADVVSVLGHADRVRPFEDYCVGLLSAEGRKSVEPLAAVTAPERTAAQHQSLLHVVAQAPWSDAAVLRRVRERVLASITGTEPLQAWIIDDTGFPKKGCHSVGVTRQYCGQLGKQDNCQVAVSLSVASHQGSLPVAWRLYLPKDWADDPVRRSKAGVPADIRFQSKPEIALQQMRQALAEGVPPAAALMDPAYGNDSKLRAGMSELGLCYAAAILPTTSVWRPGQAPLPPIRKSGRGRPATRLRRDQAHQPVSAKALAIELPAEAWRQIEWREGSNAPLASRFARLRVRPARSDTKRSEPAPEQWLLIEWPQDATEPDHYWLSTLPTDISFERMIDLTKLRWRIERAILNSNKSLASDTTKVADGEASTTTPLSASPPTASWSPKRRPFPPQDLPAPRQARDLAFPPVIGPEALPLRSQRHMPNSIATLRIRLARALTRTLPQCPCCGRTRQKGVQQIK